MTRKEIEYLIDVKREVIETLKKEIKELHREHCLLNDEKQWFTEEIEIVKVRENGKLVKKEWLIGKINWKEDFKDMSTGSVITCNRSEVVRVNGQWEW